MLDEFVEHTGGAAISSRNVSSLQDEGFEPDSNADIPLTEPDPSTPAAATAPIFDLGQVQCAINAPLVSLVVCSDILLMGLSSNVLILIELSHPTHVDRISVGGGKPFTLYKLFMDPSGRHIIITSTQGDNWYMYRPWKKAKQLPRLKMVIESIAWNKAALLSPLQPTSSREILIGARNGIIYEALLDAQEDLFKSHDRYVTEVMSLPDRHPITGIRVDFFPPSDPRKALVVVTTPSRIYQFTGTPRRSEERNAVLFTSFFAAYRDVAPRILGLPGNSLHSELHYYTPNADQALSLPRTLAWMTAHGIYYGSLNFDSSSDDFINGADVIPYPSSDPAPISIALTEFHLVMLYPDRITAVCILNGKMTYEDSFLKVDEQVRGMTADPVRKTFWVYTDQSLYELLVGNEDRDVWKIYLQNGKFDTALRYAKTAVQRNHILSTQANAFFTNGDYFKAAQTYAQCSVNFEEVALKFLDAGERDALRSYLIFRLERTKKTDRTQRMMLATWLVEFYLSKCNELDDAISSESLLHDVNNLVEERNILQADLRQFFETYKNNLDRKTCYELIQGHGRTDMYLHYANVVGDYERVVEHWILEEEWANAIDVINRQPDLELYYRFGPVLMRHAPKDTVESWLKQPSLDPHRLIPALLQRQHAPRDPLSPNQAIRFLNHIIFEQKNVSSTIHNLLITFHASSSGGDDASLLRFLSSAPCDPLTGRPYYDLDYALRICKQTGRTQPCVHIYAKMGLWENSVDLALEKGDLELAKINADMPEDDQPLRKKLWLKIAKYVVQDKKDIKTAMQFLESTDLLKIEDILPFFPDFVVIDDFKEEIAQALEGYSAHIESLKNEMNEATRTAESIKEDIGALKSRFVTIDAGEQCSSCSHLLFTRQFYVFPCRHTFHADCLIALAKEYLPAHSLRRMLALQNELTKGASVGNANPRQPQAQRTLLSSNFNPLQNGTRALGRNILSAGDRLRDLIVPDALAAVVSAPAWIPGLGRRSGIEVDGGKKAEKLRAELEELLASSCPLCETVVVGLDKPFVKEGEMDSSWTL